MIRWLIEAGANPNPVSIPYRRTPFVIAMNRNPRLDVNFLLDLGVNPELHRPD